MDGEEEGRRRIEMGKCTFGLLLLRDLLGIPVLSCPVLS